jgi:peptidyl-tRNA hydrolase
MSPGKIASQAGHAYLGAYLAAQGSEAAKAYAQDLPGTKVCLKGSLQRLERAQADLAEAGIPHFLVVDSGCLDFFNGEPTVTALGFGPALKEEIQHITRRFNLL